MSIGGDLNSLHMLPNKMKTEIALHVNLETLRKVRSLLRLLCVMFNDLFVFVKAS